MPERISVDKKSCDSSQKIWNIIRKLHNLWLEITCTKHCRRGYHYVSQKWRPISSIFFNRWKLDKTSRSRLQSWIPNRQVTACNMRLTGNGAICLPTRTAGKCSIYSKLLPPVVYGQSSPRPSLSAWQSCPWYWGVQRLGFFLIGGFGLWTPKMIRVRTFVLKGTVYCWNPCRGQLHVIVICKKTKIIARYICIIIMNIGQWHHCHMVPEFWCDGSW